MKTLINGFYWRIIFSVLVVIAAILILQGVLAHLKFRALVAEATTSRLQVVAGSVDTLVQRAEGTGLAMEEMSGLQGLLERERERDSSIFQIMVVSPIGSPITSSGSKALPVEDHEAVMRRVFGSGEKLSTIDRGNMLYSGRLLLDSANSIMGAVIVSTQTADLQNAIWKTSMKLATAYLAIFTVIFLVLIPFVVFEFSAVTRVYRALNPQALKRLEAPDRDELSVKIEEGNKVYQSALQALSSPKGIPDEKKKEVAELWQS
ncbi:hypothetical protein [Flexibacterium corallicola]|uniref:hypothetical protein n=1 Tax=Flexibacterium corallicola TaxID=3037259 RepID=UPI00286F4BCB|nr:hypothetical protein [Pseudovibrio sp. M1P-2-3]